MGITPETTPAQLMRAALEGVAFSLRQGLTELDAEAAVESASVIGGGSQSDAWCQILANVLGREILTLGGRHLSARAGSGCHRPEGTGRNCRLPPIRSKPFRRKMRPYLPPVPGSSGSV